MEKHSVRDCGAARLRHGPASARREAWPAVSPGRRAYSGPALPLARTAETPAAAVNSRGRSAISMFARGWLAVPKPVMVARPGPAGPGVRRLAPGSPDLPIGSVLTPLPPKCVPRGPLVAPRAARKGRTGTWPTLTGLAVTGLAVTGLAVTGLQ